MLEKYIVRVKSGIYMGYYLNLNGLEIEFVREPSTLYDDFRVALIIAESTFHRDKIDGLEIIPVNFGTPRPALTSSEITARFGDLRSIDTRRRLLDEHLSAK